MSDFIEVKIAVGEIQSEVIIPVRSIEAVSRNRIGDVVETRITVDGDSAVLLTPYEELRAKLLERNAPDRPKSPPLRQIDERT